MCWELNEQLETHEWAKHRDVFTIQFHDDNFDHLIPFFYLNGRRISRSKAIFDGIITEVQPQLSKNFAKSNSVSPTF